MIAARRSSGNSWPPVRLSIRRLAADRSSGESRRTVASVRQVSRSPTASEAAAASKSRWRSRASLVSADATEPAAGSSRSAEATDVMAIHPAALALVGARGRARNRRRHASSLCSAAMPRARGLLLPGSSTDPQPNQPHHRPSPRVGVGFGQHLGPPNPQLGRRLMGVDDCGVDGMAAASPGTETAGSAAR
jgi:hypothetical protein